MRDIDYEDDLPTGIAPRQPSSPDLGGPANKGSTRIDPHDVFYLTDRPLPAMSEETLRKVQSSVPPVQPVRRQGPLPELQPPSPSKFPPAPKVPRVRVPDPRVATVAFPLATRRSARPPVPSNPALPAPSPDQAGPRHHKFPPLPALRTAEPTPPVESRWGSALAIFGLGLLAVLVCGALVGLITNLYGP